VAKSPFRPLSRRQRLALRLAEGESPVERPGTSLFRASPITIGSALATGGPSAGDALVWTTVHDEEDADRTRTAPRRRSSR
jgi:hypothetical protein